MSETLRELLVGIGFKDEATVDLNKIDKKVDNIRDNFGSMGKSAAGASANIANLGTRATKTTKDIDRIDKRYKLWQQTTSSMEKALNGNKIQAESLRSKISVLDREITVSNKNLEKTKKLYGENSKEVLAYKDHIQDLQLQHAKLNKELGGLNAARMGRDLTAAGNVMTKAGSWLTRNVSLPIAVAAGASIKTFVTLEEAFSDVSKTFKGTDEQLKKTRKELDYMASNTIPVAREELYGIAANAGQLGVGAKNVVGFTDTIAKLGATTNLTYDSASSEIARFANITKMSLDDVDRLGSTIVELGNNTQTTEAEIVSMGMNLGAAGKQVGMHQAEIIGLAAGMSSLGMGAEAGGTAVSKLLYDMQEASMTGSKQLGKYAKVAGMTSKGFKQAFEKNAANALVLFTQGLGEMQKEGKNVIGTLNDMGLSEARLRDTILRAAGSNDVLNRTINTGNIAWEQNIALNEEFSNKSKTSASDIQLMKSKVEEVGNAFGEHLIPHVNKGLDLVTRMVNKFGELSPDTQAGIFNGILGVAAGGLALKGLGKVTSGLGELNTAVATAGGWGPYLTGAGASIKAFATGPVMVAFGKLALLAGVLYLVYKGIKDLIENDYDFTFGAYADKIRDRYKPDENGYYPTSNYNRIPQKKRTTLPTSSYDRSEFYKMANNNKVDNDYPKSDLTQNINNYYPTSNHNRIQQKEKTTLSSSSFDRSAFYKMIDNNYTGTNYWKGGPTRLAEHGPELVVGKQVRDLPKGSKVINNRETEDLFRNEGKSIVTQDVPFAPTLNIYLTNGNKDELEKAKDILKREFDNLMEDFFYRYRKKIASAN